MRCISCVDACPAKCLVMEMQCPVALTIRGGIGKVIVAGQKKEGTGHGYGREAG